MRVLWTPDQGAYVPVTLMGPAGTITFPGLVDTGAEDVLLDLARFRLLGLLPTGRASLDTAGGISEQATYAVHVLVAGRDLGMVPVVALPASAAPALVVGRSVLRFFHLAFDGPGRALEIS